MTGLSSFLAKLSGASALLRSQSSLDLGSATTRIMIKGKLVWNEPSCLSYHPQSDSIIAIGQAALHTIGKAPTSMKIYFPVRDGVLADVKLSQLYLATLLQTVLTRQQKRLVLHTAVTLAIPAKVTPAQKHMWLRIFHQAGYFQVTMVPKAQALFASLKPEKHQINHVGILDIGSQTTEIALFYEGQLVIKETFAFGGDTFTNELRALIRDENQAMVGWSAVETLKQQFTQLVFSQVEGGKDINHRIAVRAKDVITQAPTTVYVQRGSVQARFKTVADLFISELQSSLAVAPPEMVTVLLEQGLYVTGGGSLLSGLVAYLEQELKCVCNQAALPLTDVIRGVDSL